MVSKKAALKFKDKRQHCIYFNEVAGQKIIKISKQLILGTTENDRFTLQYIFYTLNPDCN